MLIFSVCLAMISVSRLMWRWL